MINLQRQQERLKELVHVTEVKLASMRIDETSPQLTLTEAVNSMKQLHDQMITAGKLCFIFNIHLIHSYPSVPYQSSFMNTS